MNPFGSVPWYGNPGNRHCQFGGDEAERVPAAIGPLAPGCVCLEHDVIDPTPGQLPAHGQPGLAGTDSDLG
jgi:hypothetical protein